MSDGPRSGRLRSILRGATTAGLLRVSSYGLAYLLNFLLAEWLGAAEFGRYTYTITVYGLVALVATAGYSGSALKFIPQYAVRNERATIRRFLSTAQRTLIVAGLVIGFVLFLLLHAIPGHFGAYSRTLLYGLPLIILFGLVQLTSESLRALGSVVRAYFPSQVLRPALVLGIAWCALTVTHHLNGVDVVLTVVGVMLVVGLVQRHFLYGFLRGVQPGSAGPDGGERALWWRLSFSLLVIGVLGALLRQVDLVILGWFAPTSEVGIYAIAVRLATFCGLSLVLTNILAAPGLLALYSEGRLDDMQALVSRLAHVVFWPALVASLIGGYFASDILGLFGSEYRAAAPAMVILVLGQLVNVSVGPVGHLVDLTGHHRAGIYVRAVALLVAITAALVLIPAFGILGAAIASTLAMVIWNLALYIIVVKRIGLRPSIYDALLSISRSHGS